MWRILIPQLLEYTECNDAQLTKQIEGTMNTGDTDELTSLCKTGECRQLMEAFIHSSLQILVGVTWRLCKYFFCIRMHNRKGIGNSNFTPTKLCCHCLLDMTSQNMATGEPFYLAKMHQLPDTVQCEFGRGNFVVNRTDSIRSTLIKARISFTVQGKKVGVLEVLHTP